MDWFAKMSIQHPEKTPLREHLNKRMVFLPVVAGCLTLVVAGIAFAVGFLVDSRLGTFPRWTLIVLAGSAPLSLGGIYLFLRRILKRQKQEQEDDSESDN